MENAANNDEPFEIGWSLKMGEHPANPVMLPERLDLRSMSIIDNRIDLLRKSFPGVSFARGTSTLMPSNGAWAGGRGGATHSAAAETLTIGRRYGTAAMETRFDPASRRTRFTARNTDSSWPGPVCTAQTTRARTARPTAQLTHIGRGPAFPP